MYIYVYLYMYELDVQDRDQIDHEHEASIANGHLNIILFREPIQKAVFWPCDQCHRIDSWPVL